MFGRVSADLSRAASACPMVVAAVRLAEWVGEDGLPVTPGGSLRPADVPTASATLGILTRAKVRRAADVPEVHRPWLTAVAAGLITIADGRAVQAGRLDDPLAAWWAGLQALLAAEAALVLLRLFGAIEGTRLTPLGTWVHAELRKTVPTQITPDLPTADLLAQLAGTDEVDAWNRARRWFGDRTREQIVAELVPSAAEASPAELMRKALRPGKTPRPKGFDQLRS